MEFLNKKNYRNVSIENHLNECFICHEILIKIKKGFKCIECLKIFHKKCYEIYFKNLVQKNYYNIKVCKVCENIKNKICCKCLNQIDKNKIYYICEFCGSYIHKNCIDCKLELILDRNYYKFIINNYEDIYNDLKNLVNNEEKYINYIKNLKNKENINLLLNPFFVCNLCEEKNNFTNIISSSLKENLYFPYNKNFHYININYNKKINKKENDMKMLLKINNLNLLIKKIYNINENFYIIKWNNNNYSFELKLFIIFSFR